MKKLAGMLLMIMCISSAGILLGAEYDSVQNSGFEIDEDGDGLPDGWIFMPGYPQSIIQVVERPDGKGKCLYLKASEEAKSGQTNCDACSSYEISIKPETAYTLSASIAGKARMFTFFYNEYEEEAGALSAKSRKEMKEARKYYEFQGSKFESKSVEFISPKDAKSLQIMIRNQPAMKEVWIDDVSIRPSGKFQTKEREISKEELTKKEGLVGYWKFSDAVRARIEDCSGKGNHGNLKGTEEMEDFYVEFDGQTYIEVPNLITSKPFTFESWARLRQKRNSDLFDSRDKGISSGGKGFVIEDYPNNSGKYKVAIGDGGKYILLEDTIDLSDYQWHHIAVSIADEKMRVYQDGALKAETDVSEIAKTPLNISPIAKIGEGLAGYFYGLMDEVRIYNCVLSPEEIKNHFLEGKRIVGEFEKRAGTKEFSCYADIFLPWYSWIKGQEIPLKISLANPEKKKIRVILRFLKGENLVHFQLKEFSESETEDFFKIKTDFLSLGEYRAIVSSEDFQQKGIDVTIVPQLDKETIGFGFYGYSIVGSVKKGEKALPFNQTNIKMGIDLISSANMNLFLTNVAFTNRFTFRYFLDELAKRGIGWILLFNPQETSEKATENDYSLTSEGKKQIGIHASKEKPHLSYISPLTRELLKEIVPPSVILLKDHPAFSGKVYFGDDVFISPGSTSGDFRWGPLADYGYYPLKIFKEKTGLDAPRPTKEELQKKTGVIPDNDPWLLWNHFRCENVFSDYQALICKIIKEKLGAVACSEHGSVWRPKWGFVTSSEQKALTLCGYYDYPGSPYRHIYDVELVRLVGEDKDIAVSPAAHNTSWGEWFSKEVTPEYTRACFYSILSGGGKNITFPPFQTPPAFDEGHPSVWEEWKRQGEILKRYGKLLYALKRQKEPVGLLISFSTDVYRLLEEPEPGQIYPFFKGHYYRVAGTFFSMLKAQIPVEMIDEEKILSSDLSGYKAIYLCDVTVLPSSVAKSLEKYVEKGGIVFCDNLCNVNIKGAKKIEFNATVLPIDKRDGSHYSQSEALNPLSQKKMSEAVSCLKNIFKGIIEPVLELDSLDLATRRFISGDGEEYLFVVNLNQDNHTKATMKFVGKKSAVDIFLEQGRKIESGDVVELAPAGGMFLSFQKEITDIVINAPDRVFTSSSFYISLNFYSENKPSKGFIPVHFTILNPEGEAEKEWSKYYLAKNGKLNIPVNLPFHFKKGNCTIIAEDLLSHRTATKNLKVQPEIEFEVEKRATDSPGTQGFIAKIKNSSEKNIKAKLFLICDKLLNSSFPEKGMEINLSRGEEKLIPVDISAENQFSSGLQPFEFILSVDDFGALSRLHFATLSKEEEKKKEPDLAP